MKQKNRKKIFVVIMAAPILFFLVIFFVSGANSLVSGLMDVKDPHPFHLKIPKIHVDAEVEYVGLTPLGAMDVPKGPENVAWFELGPLPGEKGASVIAGHSGWKNQIPTVFDNLNDLKKGDKIYIENKNGEIIVFVVRESKVYDPKADTAEIFGSSDDKSHLNLITCAGTWDDVSKSSSERLVVFADRE